MIGIFELTYAAYQAFFVLILFFLWYDVLTNKEWGAAAQKEDVLTHTLYFMTQAKYTNLWILWNS